MKKLKLYLETSVWNFVFAVDAPEKMDITKSFFQAINENLYEIFISEIVIKEINDAPDPKKSALFKLINKHAPMELEVTEEAIELAGMYIKRGIVPKGKTNDALHIAVATVYEIDAVVSWNYQHLANLRKSELFNAANLESGYTKRLEIVTAMEVSKYES
jgi:predicted nucleic acid-binding protein